MTLITHGTHEKYVKRRQKTDKRCTRFGVVVPGRVSVTGTCRPLTPRVVLLSF